MFVETSFPQYVMTDTLSFHFISKCLWRYSIKLLVNLLHNITFFTLHYFNREVLSVFGLFSCKIFFLFVKRNFQKRFYKHKKLIEIRRDGHDIILPEYARDNFKKNPAFKEYIVEMALIYSIIAKNASSTFIKSLKSEL